MPVYQPIGVGMVEMDIALFMFTLAAVAVQLFYLRSWMKIGLGLGLVRLLRLAGWLILAARFGSVLFTQGDIAISIASAIAVMFLAAGEIAVTMNAGKVIKL